MNPQVPDDDQIQPLPQDDETPFSPPPSAADDPTVDLDIRSEKNKLGPTHPVTDANIQDEEVYDENLAGAAEAEDPGAGDTVKDYNPPTPEDEEPAA